MTTTSLSNSDEEPPSNLVVLISRHLRRLAKKSPAIRKQFFPSAAECRDFFGSSLDPLQEDQFVKTKGLVHKYPGRVLVLLTAACASYCRFCTRRRMVSDIERGCLMEDDIDRMVGYLKATPSVTEVILSGGDPLVVPDLLAYALGRFSRLPQIKILRVHTRVPVSQPSLLTAKTLRAFRAVRRQPLYVSIHFERPDELTPATIEAVKSLRRTGAILLSQSVFLKGVNDSYHTLYTLFTRLTELGVRPYYIYRCDPTKGVGHFIVPFEKEVALMTRLRKNLSGIACPTYVIDAPAGAGKIPVPLNFWEFNASSLTDFNGAKIALRHPPSVAP